MLDFIKENTTVWENIKNTSKKIVLYGMGNGADKIIDWCEENHVKISAVFASDEFVRGQFFRGFKVCRYQDVIEQYGNNILIVIAFASERKEVLDIFRRLEEKHEVIAPHLSLFAEEDKVCHRWIVDHEQELQQVYNILADNHSKKVFANIINYKLSGKIKYLFDCETQRLSDLQDLFSFTDREVYMDLGAYNGDTVKEFLKLTSNKYQHIIAVEPDSKNFRKLQQQTESLADIDICCVGIWDKQDKIGFSESGGRQSTFMTNKKMIVRVDTIDSLSKNNRVTYIKMDVEGAEKEALQGGIKTIKAYKPKMLIAAYHYDNDIFRIPLQVLAMNNTYKVYLRKHPYVPGWELNFLFK